MNDLEFLKEKLNICDKFKHAYKSNDGIIELDKNTLNYVAQKFGHNAGDMAYYINYRLKKLGKNSHDLVQYLCFNINSSDINTLYFNYHIKCKVCNYLITFSHKVGKRKLIEWYKIDYKNLPSCEEVMMEEALG